MELFKSVITPAENPNSDGLSSVNVVREMDRSVSLSLSLSGRGTGSIDL